MAIIIKDKERGSEFVFSPSSTKPLSFYTQKRRYIIIASQDEINRELLNEKLMNKISEKEP